MQPFGGLTLDTVGVAEGVERVLAGGGCRGHIGDHHCARLVTCERVPQHLQPTTAPTENPGISNDSYTFSLKESVDH